MKNLTVKIKCKGLSVKTNDLNMAYGIIHEIKNNGIMEHIWMPTQLMDRIEDVLDKTSKRIDSMVSSFAKTINTNLRKQETKPQVDEDIITEEASKSFDAHEIPKALKKEEDAKIATPDKKIRKRAKKQKWTKAQSNIISRNPSRKAAYLQGFSSLKGKTLAQISNRRLYMRKNGLL